MISRWQNLIHLLLLARLEIALSAASNIMLTVFLAAKLGDGRHPIIEAYPLWLSLMLAAIIAGGLSVYGTSLNDVLDRRHDRTFRPTRPLPAGKIDTPTALITAVLCLLAALCAATFLGHFASVLCSITAMAILFYNVMGKHLPATGIITFALIRAMNMMIACPTQHYLWPVAVMMTHVVFCTAIAYAIEGKRPRIHGSELALICTGWAFWVLVVVGIMVWRDGLQVHGRPGLWLGPVTAATGFGIVSGFMLAGRMDDLRRRREHARSFFRLAMLWLIILDASWLLGLRYWVEGLAMLAFFAASYAIVRLIAMLANPAPPPSYRTRHA